MNNEVLQNVYGLHPSAVESQVILMMEMVAYRRGVLISGSDAQRIRGFADRIIDYVLGGGGAGRVEPTGRRYSARERDRNLQSTCQFAKKVAERMVVRAQEGLATSVAEMYIGDRRIRYYSNDKLLAGLCPPPLPPIC